VIKGECHVDTRWQKCIGCLICINHVLQQSSMISGSVSDRDKHFTASFAYSPPGITWPIVDIFYWAYTYSHMYIYMYIYTYTIDHIYIYSHYHVYVPSLIVYIYIHFISNTFPLHHLSEDASNHGSHTM